MCVPTNVRGSEMSRLWVGIRDGPKFGERRTSAEEFGRTFGSATCELFGRTSAELQQKFGATFAVLRLQRFA